MGHYFISCKSAIYYLSFLANFDLVTYGESSILIGMLWSVAVEEQFYFTWPILLSFCSKKHIPKILLFIIICSFLFRFINFNNETIINYSTLSVVADIAIGCFSAYFVFSDFRWVRYFSELTKKRITIFYLMGFLGLALFGFKSQSVMLEPFLVGVYSIFAAIFFAFIILEQNYSKNSFLKLGNIKFLSSVGKYTYGLYCFHIGAILLVISLTKFFHIHTAEFNGYVYSGEILLSGVVSVLISILSYNYFESVFLKLKTRFI